MNLQGVAHLPRLSQITARPNGVWEVTLQGECGTIEAKDPVLNTDTLPCLLTVLEKPLVIVVPDALRTVVEEALGRTATSVSHHERCCEVCGTDENVIFHPDRAGGQFLCFDHTEQYLLTQAASEHLFALFNDTLMKWVTHWRASDLHTLDLTEAADLAALKLDQMSFKERKAQIEELLKK